MRLLLLLLLIWTGWLYLPEGFILVAHTVLRKFFHAEYFPIYGSLALPTLFRTRFLLFGGAKSERVKGSARHRVRTSNRFSQTEIHPLSI